MDVATGECSTAPLSPPKISGLVGKCVRRRKPIAQLDFPLIIFFCSAFVSVEIINLTINDLLSFKRTLFLQKNMSYSAPKSCSLKQFSSLRLQQTNFVLVAQWYLVFVGKSLVNSQL